ncbi:hypothetical protein F5878DRAFT_698825 [Lentinula raphanica]|uniref:Ndc10 domain-containing protein n=1 Tax=Lentinula raphanica TaxID=153919 RepID=A0AA38P011_9AGAR|nr:hypothetical protein F5878DRAFT_698825 [Lentinula raphanica]
MSADSENVSQFSHYHTFQLDPLVSFSGPGSMKSSTSLSEQCSSSQQINGPPSKKPRIDARLSPDTAPPTLSSSATSSTETTGEEFTLISDLHEDELADLTTIQDSSFLADCSELELGLDDEDEEIDRETHAYRLQMQDEARNRNSKKDNYSRHVNAYFDWIEHQQQLRLEANPSRHRTLTAEPITAGKVALFLKYEVSRPKAKGGTGSVGSESISQTISALEKHRSERQHLPHYVANTKSHKPLRSDIRIKTFESAARRNEPLRALNAQKMKTAGPLSATYTPEELKKIAMSVFESIHPSRTSLAKALRDRSMILMCSMFAFRGDSLRAVQLSDLGVEDLPLPQIKPGYTVKIITATRDNGKHNKEGRTEQHAALRHLDARMCGIGGLAFYLFSQYHVLGKPCPDFAPDFADPDYPEIGRRDWWKLILYHGP